MTLALEQFQKDAAPWLAKVKEKGEPLFLLAGADAFEVRTASPDSAEQADEVWQVWQALLPKRDIITGDPESLVHVDWSSEWQP